MREEYILENMLYHACDGDMSKRREIGSYRIDEIVLWVQHGKYRAFVERKLMEQNRR